MLNTHTVISPAMSSQAEFQRWNYIKDGIPRQGGPIDTMFGGVVRLGFAICGIGLALALVLIHPIIGLLIGIGSISSITSMPRRGLWAGACPRCDEVISITAGEHGATAFNCPVCTGRVLVKNGQFRAI
jgi:hypothetical protein